MTDAQKQRIKEMRSEGAGYKTIAAELNISRDSIRGFCKRIGLDGKGTAAKLNAPISDTRFCKNCAKPIEQIPHGRARLFCCDSCRRAWWNAHPEAKAKKSGAVYKFICACCGANFNSYGNSKRKYCGHGCYVSHRWDEKAAVI